MSAYALPGFFPPLDEGLLSLPTAKTNSACDAVSGALEREERLNEDVMVSFSGRLASNDVHDQSSDSEFAITVKSAKIDPIKLIQALTTTTSTTPSVNSSRSRGVRRRRNFETAEETKVPSADISDSTSTKTPQETAMELELEVFVNGRRYTATRSLDQILLLQQELLQEQLEMNRPNLAAERTVNGTETTVRPVPRIFDESDATGHSATATSSGACSSSSCGFSRLHALLRSYVPMLENWFRHALETVNNRSSRMVWNHFVWEPSEPVHHLLDRHQDSFGSTSSLLDKIEESESEDDDDTE